MHAEFADAGLFASMPRFGDMCIHAVVDLRRRFTRADLERAMAATIEDFPVLGRCYQARFWRDRWREVRAPMSEAVHVVDEGDIDIEAETAAWTRRAIGVSEQRQLRVVSLPRGALGSRLVFTVTHLAVDGGGASAVAHVFGAHLYGVRPSLPVDARRSLASALGGIRLHHLPLLARDVAASLAQPFRTVAAAQRERPYPSSASGEMSVRYLTIPAADLERLKARCRSAGATINDLLVAALARVAGGRSNDGPVAVMYTMDLRRYRGSAGLTAANTSSILTAVVPRGALASVESAARAVASITSKHRRGFAGPAFLAVPTAIAGAAPHAILRRATRWLHPLMVEMPLRRGLLVTNVGKLDDGLGPFAADVESVRAVGPTIDGIDVPAVVAFGFRGQLHLELIAPPGLSSRALDELDAELRAALELDGAHMNASSPNVARTASSSVAT